MIRWTCCVIDALSVALRARGSCWWKSTPPVILPCLIILILFVWQLSLLRPCYRSGSQLVNFNLQPVNIGNAATSEAVKWSLWRSVLHVLGAGCQDQGLHVTMSNLKQEWSCLRSVTLGVTHSLSDVNSKSLLHNQNTTLGKPMVMSWTVDFANVTLCYIINLSWHDAQLYRRHHKCIFTKL